LGVGERRQWHEPYWTRHRWNDKSHERVVDCTGEELAERRSITRIGSPQQLKISIALALADDCRWISEANEKQIGEKPAGASVPVEKRMYSLELGVQLSDCLGNCACRRPQATG
jgi:hypothetical protein